MVPEVLLALLGVPGEVIVLEPAKDGYPERFRVSPDLPFLEPPERVRLDRLVSLGYAFRCLEAFVARENEAGNLAAVGGSSPDGGSIGGGGGGGGGSLYRRALAAGVAEVLASYEAAILRLEQDILRGVTPAMPAALESALSGFALVLPALHATLRPVIESSSKSDDELKGASLLHHLHAAALAAGAPQLESALRALRSRCYRALYQQLLAWMVHGLLVDPHSEFWVRPIRGAGGDGGVWLGGDGDGDGGGIDGGGGEWTGYGLDAETGSGGGGGGSYRHPHGVGTFAGGGDGADDGAFGRGDGGEGEWHRGFKVSLEALPPGVELPAAEATLFVGRAVRVLSQPRGEFRGRTLLPESISRDATAALRKLAGDGGEFDRAAFEAAVEGIRKPVAARLGRLVVGDAKLLEHMAALRSYYLLGRGDFFQSFLEEAAGLLHLPPRPTTAEADMVAPFAQAALKSSGADDPLLVNFRLRFKPSASTKEDTDADADPSSSGNFQNGLTGGGGAPRFRIPSYDGWDGLELEYAVPWPLGLLLTKEALRRYNHMFQYLFRLRRASLALDEAWCRLRRKGGGTPGSFSVRGSSVASLGLGGRSARQQQQEQQHQYQQEQRSRAAGWGNPRDEGGIGGGGGGIGGETPHVSWGVFETCQRVRHEMAFLVNNWLTYLQVDVVEAQYQTMVARVAAADDFAEAQRAHRAFLAALSAQSFLDLESVSSIVEVIMQLSSALCAAVAKLPSEGYDEDGRRGGDGGNETRSTAAAATELAAEVEAIGASFARQSTSLYTILRSNRLANDPKAPYLRQLLLRLNYNDYFVAAARKGLGRDGGGSAASSVTSSMSSIPPGWRSHGAGGGGLTRTSGGGPMMGLGNVGQPPPSLSLRRG